MISYNRAGSAMAGVAALLAAGLAGCDSDSTKPELQRVETLTIDVSHHAVALDPGNSLTIVATPVNEQDEPRDVPLIWESSDASVAVVSAEGVVTGVYPGFATIRVRALGLDPTKVVIPHEIQVHVLENAAAVTIHYQGPVVFNVGGTLELTATVTSESGEILDRPIMWFAGDPAVVSVDADGVVVALSPGQTMVTAEVCDLVTASIVVVVLEP